MATAVRYLGARTICKGPCSNWLRASLLEDAVYFSRAFDDTIGIFSHSPCFGVLVTDLPSTFTYRDESQRRSTLVHGTFRPVSRAG